ncbi:Large-conductance mechanosensitive channel [Emericellopsis cladophorae]|uniref:Large-conductance mechanosensitive channel n=1 Tax=Emericellopsis cladophorae TaxID=2686198 RepID=A0A9P9XVA3_9HYPO|nr:Large-conductance mechanosensitive channel [Emericellopsis cladophorae]KAI6778336.1 Large-conductance mechanosensitive channel [Emericellopsis cladophorae]
MRLCSKNTGVNGCTVNASPARDALVERSARKVKRRWDGFVDFALEGNVLQIAFGLILASIFTDLIKSFVGDILMSPISVLLPINKNFQENFAVLRGGDSYDPEKGYNTPAQALEDGAVVMTYGYVSSGSDSKS